MIDGVLQLELPPSDGPALASRALPRFVLGPENALAATPLARVLAGDDLAEAARLFNPLVLVGPGGSGKSQLARAIVRHWRDRLDGAQEVLVEYFTAADFGREAQAAAEDEQLPAWRRRIRGLKVLVIEDLGNLRTRATIAHELRLAIDAIVESGGLVVVTVDREPVALAELDLGIRDRLAAGLTLRLQRPGLAARRAILQLAASARGTLFTDEQLQQLAHREVASAAELVGLMAKSHSSGPFPFEGRIGEGVEASPRAARGSHAETAQLKQIIAVTARYFGVTQAALVGPSRRTSLVRARNIVVHLARRFTGLSYADIGRALGGRDHTTIMHADRRLQEQLAADPSLQQDLDELDRLMR